MCLICGWEKFSEEIEHLLDDPAYGWARQTLTGIYHKVNEKECCTEGQGIAVKNIRLGLRRNKR